MPLMVWRVDRELAELSVAHLVGNRTLFKWRRQSWSNGALIAA
jgi:hypothetical protein